MGQVLVEAQIVNVRDEVAAELGSISADTIRSVTISNALVDTGATSLSMPKSQLAELGLKYLRTRPARTSAGPVDVRIFGPARLTIQGRECHVEITELPDGCPVLVGQIPLEAMDWVVDMTAHKLVGNPRHGGEHIIELYNINLAVASGT